MSEDQKGAAELAKLPRELVDRLTKPFVRFLHIEAAAGAVLLLFAVASMVLSNSPWARAF
jgi:NhaA family Na+:H+ antiporter